MDLLQQTGVGERLAREGSVHHGICLRFNGETHRIDLRGLTGGKSVTSYAARGAERPHSCAARAGGDPSASRS